MEIKKTRFKVTRQGYYTNIDFKQLTSYKGYLLSKRKTDFLFYKKRKDILRRDLAKILLPIVLVTEKRFKDDLKVLDIGCGDGVILESLYDISKDQEINIELYGIDPDYTVFNKSRVKANFIEGVAEKMPFPDNFFHLLISSQSIEHLTLLQIRKASREAYRVLKNRGLYYIETPNPKSILAKAMRKDWWMFLPDHSILYPPKVLSKILLDYNFTNIIARSRYEKDEQINEIQEAFERLFYIKNWYLSYLGMFILKMYIIIFNKGAVTTVLAQK